MRPIFASLPTTVRDMLRYLILITHVTVVPIFFRGHYARSGSRRYWNGGCRISTSAHQAIGCTVKRQISQVAERIRVCMRKEHKSGAVRMMWWKLLLCVMLWRQWFIWGLKFVIISTTGYLQNGNAWWSLIAVTVSVSLPITVIQEMERSKLHEWKQIVDMVALYS